MDATNPNLAGRAPEDPQRLVRWLLEFELNWEEGALARRAAELPQGLPRRTALAGLVQIDLRRQWRQGRKKLLEDYLRAYPELGTPETVGLDLIQAELLARKRVGDFDAYADVARRFPRQMAQLRRAVLQVCGDPARPEPGEAKPPGEEKKAVKKDRYELLRELGRGMMGTVYLARDTWLCKQMAMKIPHFGPNDSPDLRERFMREARSAARLDHPNICPVYDVGEEDGRPYITMAYIEGQTLADVLRACNPMPQRRAAEVVAKLARALEEAHRQGIIHRHLTPSNVMVKHNGEPVIIDFGLAKCDRDASITSLGSVLGTPAYMSPEHVNGETHRIGPSSDQWSLGVILYELLTGQVPFRGTVGQVMARILTEAPRPPSWVQPDLDPELEEVCLRALAREPADRFASAGEFAGALECFLAPAGNVP